MGHSGRLRVCRLFTGYGWDNGIAKVPKCFNKVNVKIAERMPISAVRQDL
jgi:hypothetical protein